ncbi:hypothetical protein NP493_643g04034 [Ridgeia piscesae]|uniref:2-oxo-4-hydroxy-4-carboxy-5-ureidoimidazoline decarboxylase n=1 Tax=Ridgeia piscesae TaxID=27915 RepID=A0AAD9KSM0_RIDPI|nr:hypothetical protein NP493_643g04034 [Ridgeia piscesae]
MDGINNLKYDHFIEKFGNVVEHCPIIAAVVWAARPFPSFADLFDRFSTVIDSLSMEMKAGILRCHPDLAGRLAATGQLTPESMGEQRAAGLLDLSPSETVTMATRNDQYKAKFGFPFVVCARENKKAAILSGLEDRLLHSVDEEVQLGIDQVKNIVRLRLQDLVNMADARL